MKTVKKIVRQPFFKVLVAFFILFIFISLLDHYGSSDSVPEYPDYTMLDLESNFDVEKVYRGEIDDETIEFLFYQTGLGEEGLKDLAKQCDNSSEFLAVLEKYQKQLFYGNEENEMITLKDGDILVSVSQRFCFYPHGHAAIVIDGEEKKILEAKSYAAGSCISTTKKWNTISSFVILRVKDEVEMEYGQPSRRAAVYAEENLEGLEYSLIKDIRPLADTTPEYTQCAHLVWYAYYACGLDIDENRGFIIKPKDFLKSDVLEVVQVFGVNPKNILELRNE